MFATHNRKDVKHPADKSERGGSAPGEKAASEQNPIWQSLALSPTGMQAKLAVSQPDDPYEQEADRVADQAMRMGPSQTTNSTLSLSSSASFKAQRKCPECEDEQEEKKVQRKESSGDSANSSTTAPTIVHEALSSPGQPLDPTTRSFMETRFNHDFGRVRVHTDGEAVAAARAVQALAYTVGRDIVFGFGKYAPAKDEGKRLLAHELAHVVQQANASEGPLERLESVDSNLERNAARAAAGESPVRERAANLTIARQTPQPVAAAPQFSVDRTAYEQMLAQAVGRVSGLMVDRETFSTIVQPAMVAMLQSPEWRDSMGVSHGGATARFVHPGPPPLPLDLRLVLDDTADPHEHGHFRPAGDRAATVTLSVRRNSDADTAVTTFYHEMMHFVAWLLNRPTPAVSGPAFARRTRELDMSRQQVQIAVVAGHLEALARTVSSRRATADRATVTREEATRVARFLVEEVHVRSETEVFRLVAQEQAARAAGGPSVLIGTQTYADVNRAMVDRYVFDFTSFSPLFRPTDRAGLTALDVETVTMLADILEGIYQSSVRHRYQRPMRISIPREQMHLGITPLQPPSFVPRIEPPTRREPF